MKYVVVTFEELRPYIVWDGSISKRIMLVKRAIYKEPPFTYYPIYIYATETSFGFPEQVFRWLYKPNTSPVPKDGSKNTQTVLQTEDQLNQFIEENFVDLL